MKIWQRNLASAGVAAGLCAAVAAQAQTAAGVMISPPRVMLDGRIRAAEVVIVNRSRRATTYRMSLIDMRLTEDGRLERIAEGGLHPDENSAKALLKYSPRQATLQAGESQVIRVAFSRRAGIVAGEYRSHLLVEEVPVAPSVGEAPPSDGVTLRINMVGAVTIPVIVRYGQLSASAKICDAKLTGNRLTLRIERSGNRSVRGKVSVYYLPKGSSKKIEVGRVEQFAVYVPNPSRLVTVSLSAKGNLDLLGGKLLLRFVEPPTVPNGVHAEAEIDLR
jgi:P pilus assembly chaperone PapD